MEHVAVVRVVIIIQTCLDSDLLGFEVDKDVLILALHTTIWRVAVVVWEARGLTW
jgi:hypothetical protein